MKLQIAVGRIIGACPGLFLPWLFRVHAGGQAGLGVFWRVLSMGCAGLCLPWASAFPAAAVELRIWGEKQGWEGAKPFQNLGRNRRE